MNTVRLVMGRELRAWRKPFLISTAVILLLTSIGLTIVLIAAADDDPTTYRIGVVGATPANLSGDLAPFLPRDSTLDLVSYDTIDAARTAATEGEVALVVVGDTTVIWGEGVTDALADGVVQTLVLSQAHERATEAGLTPAEADRVLTPRLTFIDATSDAAAGSSQTNEAVAVFATIVMFMAILAYGQWIGYAVVEEKANRVVEVLLGAVRPHQLMAAKVISIGTLGLIQITAVGVLVIAFGVATDRLGAPAVRPSTVLWAVVWFFLGYAFYGSLYAAAGSLASNSQEAGSTIGPLSMILAAGYISGIISFGAGADTRFIQAMSLIPLWSPLTMPGRIVRGWAAPWEVLLALVLMAAATYGMIRLSGWIYAGGVARASSKLSWREAFRTGRDLEQAPR
jgi:ABC-2 type transport system permease protein